MKKVLRAYDTEVLLAAALLIHVAGSDHSFHAGSQCVRPSWKCQKSSENHNRASRVDHPWLLSCELSFLGGNKRQKIAIHSYQVWKPLFLLIKLFYFHHLFLETEKFSSSVVFLNPHIIEKVLCCSRRNCRETEILSVYFSRHINL